VLFEVKEMPAGGVASLYDKNSNLLAVLGASGKTGNGFLSLTDPSGHGFVQLAVEKDATGRLEFDVDRVKTAEIANGTKGTMGFRIWNESHNEVVTLEAVRPGEDTTGGGGLMIHNYNGGVAATIAPNHFGVGIFHGITAVMPVNHP
jgi:hypothetical protein